jgi:hypothetical protein
MQREEREFQREPDRQERKRRQHRAMSRDGPQTQCHVDQVEGARLQVQQADADHDEGRADRAHDQYW